MVEKERDDIAVVTSDSQMLERIANLSKQLSFSFRQVPSLEAVVDDEKECLVCVSYFPEIREEQAATEMAQACHQQYPSSYLVCVVNSALSKDIVSQTKKYGANLILLPEEAFNSSKLEFITTQVLRSTFLPVKVSDLVADKVIPFTLYHLLPQRKKFLRFAAAERVLEKERLDRCVDVKELYVHKSQVNLFNTYIQSNTDLSATGLARRCRSQFLALYGSYAELVFLLTDQSEKSSFAEGQRKLALCQDLSSKLMTTLGEFGNAWDIINNSAVGELGLSERAPAVAAYCALFALLLDFKNVEQIMLGALLADIGLLSLSPSITDKLREDRESDLDPQERAAFEKYPLISLQLVLDRKLPIEEKLRNIITNSQERADGKGFPKHVSEDKLYEEAELLHFCREFDRRTMLRLGRPRTQPLVVLEEMIREEIKSPARISARFRDKLKKAFLNEKAS